MLMVVLMLQLMLPYIAIFAMGVVSGLLLSIFRDRRADRERG